MKVFLRVLLALAAFLPGVALVFSCEEPDDPNNEPPVKTIPVEKVRLDVNAKELLPGETFQLTATMLPENATDKDKYTVVWESSAPAIAKVSDSGLVTAVNEGTAVISVSIAANMQATCEVTVKKPDRVEGVIKAADFGQKGESGAADHEAGYDFSYQFTPRAALVSNEATDAVSDVWTDGHTYTFTLPATEDPYYGNTSCIYPDDILVFRDCEDFPGGAAIKIVRSSDAQNKRFEYEGYQVPIEDVFQNLHMETSQLNLGDVRQIVDEDGNPVEYTRTRGGGGFEIAIPELFGKNFTASLNLGENMSITPKMRIGFRMDLAADVVDCKLTYARCRVEAEADLSCDLTFKASVEKKFRTKRLTVFLGAIPIGPVVVSPVITMDFEVKLSGQVDLTLSVAYQKGVYAHAFYNGDNLQCRVGELKPSDTKDPFAASGNLSGAVEFGPNLGMGVSLYGGALALGVDFDPHLVFTVFSSYPISLEGLQNIGNGYYWLTQAGFEPSLAFSFGGYIQAAYAWSMDFRVPEELGLSYSFGKTYVVPQLAGPVTCYPERTAATVTATLKNKAMFDNRMYMKVKEADDPSDNWKEVSFTPDGTPNNEEPVEAHAIISPVKPFQQYTVAGPFMKISLFGKELEVDIARSDQQHFYTVDEKTENAVRALLAAIYACGDGNWKDCNWNDPTVPFSRLDNVYFHYDTDREVEIYGGEEGYYRKKLGIYVPDTWKMGNNLTIGDCTSSLDDLGWELTIHGGVVFDSIEIEDPNFVAAYGDDSEEFGHYRHIWPARNRLVIHSKRFDNGIHNTFVAINASNTNLYVDLSGTGIRSFYTGDTYDEEVLALSGTVILDNCPDLYDIYIRGPHIPEKFSYKNCPKLYKVEFDKLSDSYDLKNYSGHCERVTVAESTGKLLFWENVSMDDLTIQYNCSLDLALNGTGVKNFSSTLDWHYDYSGIGDFSSSDCPTLSDIRMNGAKSVQIANCPALETLIIEQGIHDTNNDGFLNNWDGPLESISVSGTTSLKYIDISSSHLNGTVPSWIQSASAGTVIYPYKYDYWLNDDGKLVPGKIYPSGYTMPGEPERPYKHCMQGYYDID